MTKRNVEACVLKTDGINCDEETRHALELAGACAHVVHINDFRSADQRFGDYDLLAIPGGFSYGDDVASGKVLATEIVSYFKGELAAFTANPRKLLIGICNGFQVLVRAGLLPSGRPGAMRATLALNARGEFDCRWVKLKIEESPCAFLRGFQPGDIFELPVAHGEGRFWADDDTLQMIEAHELVALRYADGTNPNGSQNDIAGICNVLGNVFGLMPHPERFVYETQHPNWRSQRLPPLGFKIFESAVRYLAA